MRVPSHRTPALEIDASAPSAAIRGAFHARIARSNTTTPKISVDDPSSMTINLGDKKRSSSIICALHCEAKPW